MTDISPLTSTAEVQSKAQDARANLIDPEDAEASSGFDEFLTLLTVQLRNQDPLNPMDSTQFVEQLATFTSVEQQIGTNTRLDQLIETEASVQLAELASWIGRDVQAFGVGFNFDGDELKIDMPGDEVATRASVVIRDQDNREVATLTANPLGGEVVWDGKTNSGAAAGSGVYNVEFVYGYGAVGDPLAPEARTVPAEAFGRVREARLDEDGGVLILESGQELSPSAITAVKTPDPASAT
ncbi:MAG: hypothetical protein KTR21_14775 [Rhodobacteraceae bacterium]|nr:hypothetical protein [Paracoccaceae bacterium]